MELFRKIQFNLAPDDPGGGGGDPTPSADFAPWTSQVPKDLLDDSFKGVKTLGDYVKSTKQLKEDHAKAAEKLKSAIFPPAENATEAEKAAYRKALGVPEKAEEYKIDAKDAKPERIAALKDFALRNHMTRAQTAALFEWEERNRLEMVTAVKAQRSEKQKAAESFLHNEYGEKSREKVEHAFRLVEKIGGEDLKNELNATGLGNSVNLIKFVVKLAESFNEDGIVIGEAAGGGDKFDPASLYPKSNHKPRGKG